MPSIWPLEPCSFHLIVFLAETRFVATSSSNLSYVFSQVTMKPLRNQVSVVLTCSWMSTTEKHEEIVFHNWTVEHQRDNHFAFYFITAVSPTTTATLVVGDFTVNFTVTNLRFQEGMRTPHSKIFSSTEKILTTLVTIALFQFLCPFSVMKCQILVNINMILHLTIICLVYKAQFICVALCIGRYLFLDGQQWQGRWKKQGTLGKYICLFQLHITEGAILKGM